MAALLAAIHGFLAWHRLQSRGWPGQARPWRWRGDDSARAETAL